MFGAVVEPYLPDGDEVDQFLDATEQAGLKVCIAIDVSQDSLPGRAVVTVPAESADNSTLPRSPRWNGWPGGDADGLWFDRLPDIDERVADHMDIGCERSNCVSGDP